MKYVRYRYGNTAESELAGEERVGRKSSVGMSVEEEVQEQFLVLGVALGPDGVAACAGVCSSRGVSPEELAEAWLAHSLTHAHAHAQPEPTEPQLLQMLDRQAGPAPRPTEQPPPPPQDRFDDENVMSDYLTTPKNIKTDNGQCTPVNRPSDTNRTPLSSLKPATYSSSKNKSMKFSTRTNAGEILTSFGDDVESLTWMNMSGNSCKVSLVPNVSGTILSHKTMYGFELLQEKTNILDSNIKYLSQHILNRAGIKETISVKTKTQIPAVVIGRVDCDSNGRLNSKSVILQGTWDDSFGHSVPVDLDSLLNYSLFPGQIVAMRGLNIRGEKFITQEILSDGSYSNVSKMTDSFSFGDPLQMLIASGPYTTSDNLDYDPLSELIAFIIKHKPHSALLIGPFLDVNHDSVQDNSIAENYKTYFEKLIDKIMTAIEISNCNTQIVMVSSSKDVFHMGIYPSPPFTLRKNYSNLTLASDPCILDVEGIKIGLTSSDILMHLSREEISVPPQGPDKIGRLCTHLLNQQSFYPLWPPNAEMSLDTALWSEHAHMSTTPHILVLPSDLQYFIKNVNNCIAINPGHLTKGIGGGTFSRVQIIPTSQSVNVAGQILRI